jgi:hypothetical protein
MPAVAAVPVIGVTPATHIPVSPPALGATTVQHGEVRCWALPLLAGAGLS